MARLKYGELVKEPLTKDLVKVCSKLGYMAALEAYRNKTYANRTYNLHDSYGSAVYVRGKLVKDTIRYAVRSRSAMDKRGTNGRAELLNYLTKLKVNSGQQVTIVVVAAMWYAEYVESKGYEVLDYHIVQDVIISNFDKEVKPIFKKYGAEAYIPNIRTWLGFEEY